MGMAMFYHQTRTAAADTLAVNLPRALAQGWRAMVRGTDPTALDRLDAALWLKGGDDGFLPHGREGGAHDADQPVLLGLGAPVNGAKVLALMDGADATDTEIVAMERVWIIFDDAGKTAARDQWRTITAAGHAAQYWSEGGGRWVMQAESTPR